MALVTQGLIALGGTGATLWWAFSGVDIGHVYEQFAAVPLITILLVLGSQIGLHIVRTARWGILVGPLGNASSRDILAAASIGFPATFFLPFRLGELARPAMISRSGVPFASAMASVVVERIVDGLTGVGLLFFMLSILPNSTEISSELQTVSYVALSIFGGGLLALALTVAAKKTAFAILRGTLGRVSAGFTEGIIKLLSAFIDGLSGLREGKRLAGYVGLTALYWGASCVAIWLLPAALQPGIPMTVGPFIICVTTFMIMIPSAPAAAGTLEAGFVLAMGPFGTSKVDAITVALSFHAIQIAAMVIIGIFGLLITDTRNLRKNAQAPAE